jgi:hypothetical protein
MTPLIFLDTETTGLRPDIHTPWEIAWVTALHDGGSLEVIHRRTMMVDISATRLDEADNVALDIGRFAERWTDADKIPQDLILRQMRADLGVLRQKTGQIAHLVAAVPSFDHAMICNNWTGWPGFGEGLWHYHLIDVEILAAGRLGVEPPYSSSDLTAAMNVTVDEASKHTAMGDVEWAMALYAAVYDLEVT